MKNIISYCESVNIEEFDNQENSEIRLHLAEHLMYIDSKNVRMFRKIFTEKYWYYGLKANCHGDEQKNCTHGTPTSLAVTPEAKSKEPKRRKNRREKYRLFYELSDAGILPTYYIEALVKEFVSHFNSISLLLDNVVCFISQNQKGTERYQTKQKWRLVDFCKECDKRFENCIFLTLTMAQEEYHGNFIKAYQDFSRWLTKFLNSYSHRWGGAYCSVIESTAKGFPHAHILCYMDEKVEHEFTKKRGKKKGFYISGGEWYEWLKRNWNHGFFDSDINRRANTYNYLVKYIAKASVTKLRELAKKKHITAEDLKMFLTIALPCVSGTRGFRFSQLKDLPKESAECAKPSVSLSEKERLEAERKDEEFAVSAEAREAGLRYLKMLSINSDISCRKKIGFYSQKDLDKEFSGRGDICNKFPEERKRAVHEKYAKPKCNGCIKSLLIDYYSGKDDSLFKRTLNVDLFVSIIASANEEIVRNEDFWQKSLPNFVRFSMIFNKIVEKMGICGTDEQIRKQVECLMYMNPLLWIFYLPPEVAGRGYALRFQINRELVDQYKNSRMYGKIIDMFEDFFLTYSASGDNM